MRLYFWNLIPLLTILLIGFGIFYVLVMKAVKKGRLEALEELERRRGRTG